MNQTESQYMYRQLGISEEVWRYGQKTEESLKERFREFDETAEYNQLKVIHAMQENRVSEGCFNYVSGYGYNDLGRDTLEQVYASAFHTEAALVRPQITCGTHALALALSATALSLNGVWWAITLSSILKGLIIPVWFLVVLRQYLHQQAV